MLCSSTEYSQPAMGSRLWIWIAGNAPAIKLTCGCVGALVSSVHETTTISETFPCPSKVRAQIILVPSPATTKLSPSPRIQVRP